jgi:SAM-dependent methyltransferase
MLDLHRYYQSTYHRPIRESLRVAVDAVQGPKVALDCGCGAGADIEVLLSKDFVVHAFDLENDAIELCKQRFRDYPKVTLSTASFEEYVYPKHSLTVADSSLFFCARDAFPDVWARLSAALKSGGIFCGSFLGRNDDMHGPGSPEITRWRNTLAFEEYEIENLFENYDLLSFNEYDVSSDMKRWHIYSVVAAKQ